MTKDNFTPTPNILFDKFIRELSGPELKTLLVIIRQTNGWINIRTGKRKENDRITHSQFIIKTGLSRRTITETINTLSHKKIIKISDHNGSVLNNPDQRKGKYYLYYSLNLEPVQNLHILPQITSNLCKLRHQPVQTTTSTYAKSAHNKRNYNKRNLTKERIDNLQKIKDEISQKWNIK